MLVDVHCHLHFKDFDKDRADVIRRAKDVNVVAIVSSGTDLTTNKQVLALAKEYDIVQPCLGMYPTDVEKLSEKTFKEELTFIKEHHKELVAIGEVGLDFHHTTEQSLKEVQIDRFKVILQELQPLGKTFVIHSRKAEKECIEILEELQIKKVMFHCFTGKFSLVKRIAANGWSCSIPANIARSSQFQGMVELLSINNLLTETDAPYLGPNPPERNEPMFVRNTVKKIAEIKQMTEEEVIKNIFLNYQKLFS